jgi:hypothetical protein
MHAKDCAAKISNKCGDDGRKAARKGETGTVPLRAQVRFNLWVWSDNAIRNHRKTIASIQRPACRNACHHRVTIADFL